MKKFKITFLALVCMFSCNILSVNAVSDKNLYEYPSDTTFLEFCNTNYYVNSEITEVDYGNDKITVLAEDGCTYNLSRYNTVMAFDYFMFNELTEKEIGSPIKIYFNPVTTSEKSEIIMYSNGTGSFTDEKFQNEVNEVKYCLQKNTLAVKTVGELSQKVKQAIHEKNNFISLEDITAEIYKIYKSKENTVGVTSTIFYNKKDIGSVKVDLVTGEVADIYLHNEQKQKQNYYGYGMEIYDGETYSVNANFGNAAIVNESSDFDEYWSIPPIKENEERVYSKDYFDSKSTFYETLTDEYVISAYDTNWDISTEKVLYKNYLYDDRYKPKQEWMNYFQKELSEGTREYPTDSPVVITESYEFNLNGKKAAAVVAMNIDIFYNKEIKDKNIIKTAPVNTAPIGENHVTYDMSAVFVEGESQPIDYQKSKFYIVKNNKGSNDESFFDYKNPLKPYYLPYYTIQLDENGELTRYMFFSYHMEYDRTRLTETSYVLCDVNGDGKDELIIDVANQGNLYSYTYIINK